MPFERPTLATLIARAQADAETRLDLDAPLLPVSNIAVLARVLAGAAHGLYGYLGWIADQVLPDTAEAEWLARHAGIWGIARQAATYATGAVTLTGTSGVVVPSGTRLRRADGVEYLTSAAITLGSDPSAPVIATAPGAGGNAAAGVGLTLVSALAGVQAAAEVSTGGITAGAPAESDDSLRGRLLARIQSPPQGGSAADYVAWARAAHPAVTRAWCYPEEGGPGTVTVRVMTDDATANGIPAAGVVTAVADAIADLRPVTASVLVLAPVAAPLDFVLSVVPDTPSVRAAVQAAVADLIRRETAPGGVLARSHLQEAISTAAGETDHDLIAPSADVAASVGTITTVGSWTWT